MGWQDDPVLSDVPTPGSPPAPQGAQPDWMGDPVVNEPAQAAPTPEPTMGQVAANAVPKGLANLLNTPMTLASLIMQGIANLPGAGHFQGLQEAADNQELKRNAPMDLAKSAGLVKPENEPQTGPQRIVDMAIQTAIGSAVVPGGGLAGAAKGAMIGAASGGAAQTTKELTGSDLLAMAVGVIAPFGVTALMERGPTIIATQGQKEVLKEAQKYGFQVEPSKVRQPSSALESIAGPAPIAQQAAMNNQRLANELTAKALGLPSDTALSPSLLDAVKKTAATPYRELDQYMQQAKAAGTLPYFARYHTASLTDEWVAARQHASELWKSYWADPKIEIKRAAEAAGSVVKSVEADIDMVAQATGHPDLLPRLQAGRQMYARVNTVEEVTNVGSYNVSLPKLGKMAQKGEPLINELGLLGRFAKAFPRVARETESVPPVGVSATNVMVAEGMAAAGAGAAGSPAGLPAGGVPLLRGPARNKVLSESYQSNLLKPAPTPTPKSATASRAGMVSAILQGNQTSTDTTKLPVQP